MNTKISKIIHSQVFAVILIVTLMCMVVFVGTYAWFTWSSTENTELTMTIGKLADVSFISGNDITTKLTPVFNYYDGASTSFSVINNSTGDTSGTSYTIKLNITTIPEILRRNDVKYALTKNDVLVAQNDLSTATDESSIDVYTSSLDSGTTNYVFYLYIDSNIENDSAMINQTIVGNITLVTA